MHLHAETWLPLPRSDVFPFFADATNLQRLTPSWVHFRIRSPQPIVMRDGATIEYRIRIRGIPMTWLTGITSYQPPEAFVDEQLRGSYRRWVHTHRFVEHHGGTLVLDDVDFAVPGGRLGAALVVPDIRRIFTFRHEALVAAFDQPRPWPLPQITIAPEPPATAAIVEG
jgi:ligand-binding SRPBCC domain-containing protein